MLVAVVAQGGIENLPHSLCPMELPTPSLLALAARRTAQDSELAQVLILYSTPSHRLAAVVVVRILRRQLRPSAMVGTEVRVVAAHTGTAQPQTVLVERGILHPQAQAKATTAAQTLD
jgi:hypothetical protein